MYHFSNHHGPKKCRKAQAFAGNRRILGVHCPSGQASSCDLRTPSEALISSVPWNVSIRTLRLLPSSSHRHMDCHLPKPEAYRTASTHPHQQTAQNPLVCSTVRNLLGNPVVIPSDEKADYEAAKTWNVFLPGFERAGGNCTGAWRDLFRTMGTDYNKKASVKFAPIQYTLNDGDIIWATWRPSSTLRQAVRERFPEDIANNILSMVGDLPQAGFTGFFKIKLILEDGGKVVRCHNNTNFWVKRLEGPTHYWEEEQNYDFHFPIQSQETQVQPDDDDGN